MQLSRSTWETTSNAGGSMMQLSAPSSMADPRRASSSTRAQGMDGARACCGGHKPCLADRLHAGQPLLSPAHECLLSVSSDPWLKDLAPDRFATTAAKNPKLNVELRWHDGYDHTLAFFVAVGNPCLLRCILSLIVGCASPHHSLQQSDSCQRVCRLADIRGRPYQAPCQIPSESRQKRFWRHSRGAGGAAGWPLFLRSQLMLGDATMLCVGQLSRTAVLQQCAEFDGMSVD